MMLVHLFDVEPGVAIIPLTLMLIADAYCVFPSSDKLLMLILSHGLFYSKTNVSISPIMMLMLVYL